MEALKMKEVKEVGSPKLANELLGKGWSVLAVFLKNRREGNATFGQIVYVLGKNVKNCEKHIHISNMRENIRYS
jgi:hypothetical protein